MQKKITAFRIFMESNKIPIPTTKINLGWHPTLFHEFFLYIYTPDLVLPSSARLSVWRARMDRMSWRKVSTHTRIFSTLLQRYTFYVLFPRKKGRGALKDFFLGKWMQEKEIRRMEMKGNIWRGKICRELFFIYKPLPY